MDPVTMGMMAGAAGGGGGGGATATDSFKSTKLDQFTMRDFNGGGINVNRIDPLMAAALVIGGSLAALALMPRAAKKSKKKGRK